MQERTSGVVSAPSIHSSSTTHQHIPNFSVSDFSNKMNDFQRLFTPGTPSSQTERDPFPLKDPQSHPLGTLASPPPFVPCRCHSATNRLTSEHASIVIPETVSLDTDVMQPCAWLCVTLKVLVVRRELLNAYDGSVEEDRWMSEEDTCDFGLGLE